MTSALCPVQDLEAGDEYVVRLVGGMLATRTVLAVLERTSMGGVLLQVRDECGNAFRSHMYGIVDRLQSGCVACDTSVAS